MAGINNIDAFATSYGYYQDLYKQYSVGEGSYGSFLRFSLNTNVENVFQDWEDKIEGEQNDGISGNTINYNRFYSDDAGETLFQAANGEIIELNSVDDASEPQINIYTEETDISNLYENLFNIEAGSYSWANYGVDGITFERFSFEGFEDKRADKFDVKLNDKGNAKWSYEEIDTVNKSGLERLSKIITDYIKDFCGNLGDFRNIFGWNNNENNISYGNDAYKTWLKAIQNSTNFELKLDRYIEDFENFNLSL